MTHALVGVIIFFTALAFVEILIIQHYEETLELKRERVYKDNLVKREIAAVLTEKGVLTDDEYISIIQRVFDIKE